MTHVDEFESLADELANFIQRLTLLNIRCIKVAAELGDVAPNPATRIRVELTDKVLYALGDDFLGAKFTASVTAFDAMGDVSAHVETVHVIEHALDKGETPSGELVSAYLHTNGLFLVYPYIRETVQDAFTRIGAGNLVLGILPRGTELPIRIEIVTGDESDGEIGTPPSVDRDD